MLKKRLNGKFFRLFGATFVARAFSAIGNLLLLIVVAKLYGSQVLGQFSLGVSILAGTATLACFGSDMSLLRHGSIAWTAQDRGRVLGLHRQSLYLTVGLSIGLSICLFSTARILAIGVLDKPDMVTTLRASAVVLPAFPLMFLQSAWLKACGLPQLSPLAEMGGAAFLTAAIFVLLHFTGLQLEASGLILVFGATIILIYVVGFWIWFRCLMYDLGPASRQSTLSYEAKFFKELPDYAVPSIMTYFTNWGVVFIAGIYVNYDQIAALTVALRVALLVHSASTIIMAITVRQLGPLYQEKRLNELEAVVHHATLVSIGFGGPIALSMIFFPNSWTALFGLQLPILATLVPIFAAARFIAVAMGPVGLLLYMSGHAAVMRRIVLTVSSMGIAGAITGLTFFGIYGAAGAIVFIVITQNVAAAILVRRHLGFYAIPVLSKNKAGK